MLYANITDDGVNYFRPHTHKHHEIMFVLKGEGTFFVGDKKIPFSPGLIFVVSPGVVHSVKSVSGHKIINVGGYFDKLVILTDGYSQVFDNEHNEARMLAEAILRNMYINEEYAQSLCKAYVQYILMHIDVQPNMYLVIKKIIGEIENRFDDPTLNVTEILNTSGYAEDYIRYKFQEIMKTTPVKYLTSVRMRNAKTLIKLYDFNISEVGQRCGIPDAGYFSRLFKNHFGISPKQYKESLK